MPIPKTNSKTKKLIVTPTQKEIAELGKQIKP